jgi:hypothetical protein
MMDKWLQKTKPGDKGLIRPPVSVRVSVHKNEVRSIDRGYFQIQFRVSVYRRWRRRDRRRGRRRKRKVM